MKYHISILLLLFVFLAQPEEAFAQKKRKREKADTAPKAESLDLSLEKSSVFAKSFTGFALYDPAERNMLYEYNSDKYFTPASNTKILTLFASLHLLPDSIPALRYKKQGDLLVFWGTGDPSFLNPHLAPNTRVYDFLKNRPETLLFCPSNFADARYGNGWMWSDFPYAYQPEKSPFPVYGNVAHFTQNQSTNGVEVLPSFLKKYLLHDPSLHKDDYIGRAEFENQFALNDRAAGGEHFDWQAPFRATPAFLVEILSDTLRRTVHLFNEKSLPPADAGTIYSTLADTLYRPMMHDSDNFIAEQLLLLCAGQQSGSLNTEQTIDFVLKNWLSDLPDKPRWADGSGLSRYNLLTPRSLVAVLDKIQQKVPRQRLLEIFPAGGVSGTVKNNYKNGNKPYVFAKTGTLRYTHCLSGYLLTKSGKLLIFSFMHNNFTISTGSLKKEMEEVLRRVYEEG